MMINWFNAFLLYLVLWAKFWFHILFHKFWLYPLSNGNSSNDFLLFQPTQENNCDSSYPDVCIPEDPPDLDCGDTGYSNFRVIKPDPNRFDGDKDGIGCES